MKARVEKRKAENETKKINKKKKKYENFDLRIIFYYCVL